MPPCRAKGFTIRAPALAKLRLLRVVTVRPCVRAVVAIIFREMGGDSTLTDGGADALTDVIEFCHDQLAHRALHAGIVRGYNTVRQGKARAGQPATRLKIRCQDWNGLGMTAGLARNLATAIPQKNMKEATDLPASGG